MPQKQISKSFWLQAIGIITFLFFAGLLLFRNANLESWAQGRPFWLRAMVMLFIGANVFLPAMSSAIMIKNATLFQDEGPLVAFLISFSGSMLAWTIWYWLGRLFGWTGRTSAAPDPELAEADGNDGGKVHAANNGHGDRISKNVHRYGVGALIVTRPVPILAELTAAACGIAHMNFWRFLIGAALGVAPMAALYTWMGKQYGDTWIAPVVAVLVPCGLYLVIARPWRHRPK
jgi:uncharacterized membrane protein YdjX (TVP38/TMEM64 family)